jgi:hypothetical protein
VALPEHLSSAIIMVIHLHKTVLFEREQRVQQSRHAHK